MWIRLLIQPKASSASLSLFYSPSLQCLPMILEKVSASNLKGQRINVKLGPATAIIGPNASGKTAILEAIKLVCRGKFPEVKKGSWPELIVEGRFEGSTVVNFVKRSINAKGTVTTESSFSDEMLEELDLPLLDPEYYF